MFPNASVLLLSIVAVICVRLHKIINTDALSMLRYSRGHCHQQPCPWQQVTVPQVPGRQWTLSLGRHAQVVVILTRTLAQWLLLVDGNNLGSLQELLDLPAIYPWYWTASSSGPK